MVRVLGRLVILYRVLRSPVLMNSVHGADIATYCAQLVFLTLELHTDMIIAFRLRNGVIIRLLSLSLRLSCSSLCNNGSLLEQLPSSSKGILMLSH